MISFFRKRKLKDEKTNVEMQNVINSMFLCNALYDKLKVKCHPDKFINDSDKLIAQNLFQELQKARYNYNGMVQVERQIDEFLFEMDKSNPPS